MSDRSSDPLEIGLRARLRNRRSHKKPILDAPQFRHLQSQIWADEHLNPDLRNYTVVLAWRIEANLERKALAQAVETICQNHDALRLHAVEEDGRPVPAFHARHPLGLEILEVGSDLAEECDLLIQAPIRMRASPLSRFALLVSGETSFFVIRLHHSITDHRSNVLLIRRLSEAYSTALTGSESETSVGNQYLSSLKTEQSPVAEAADLPALNWPASTTQIQGSFARHRCVQIPEQLVVAIAERAHQNSCTLYGLIAAAYQFVLAAYCDQTETTIGVSRSTRENAEEEETLGFFLENISVRTEISPGSNLLSIAQSITRAVTQPLGHQNLRPRNAVNATCILYRDSFEPLRLADAHTVPHVPNQSPTSVDLHLGLTPSDGGLSASFEGRCSVFSERDLEKISSCLLHVLQQFVNEPSRPFSDVSLMRNEDLEADHAAHFVEAAVSTGSLIDAFREIVRLLPDEPALRSENQSWDYKNLDTYSDELALGFHEQGLRAGNAVALLLPRGPDLVCASIAVLKLGGIVVPVDTALPDTRVETVLRQAQADFVVGHMADVHTNAKPLALKAVRGVPPATPEVSENDTAYILFTSGSTGTPKGALTPHRAILRLAKHLTTPNLSPGDRMAQFASPSFDGALIEIWPTLLGGAELVVTTAPLDRLSRYFELIQDNAITHSFLSTSVFNALVDSDRSRLGGLRWLAIGGEAISPTHTARFQSVNPDCKLVNGYGPTENGAFTTLHVVSETSGASIPIGTALPNSHNFVVSANGALVPSGFAGELWIGGEGLSKGYAAAPELTEAAFVRCEPKHFGIAGERKLLLYRTGDRVKRRDDGALVYLGRQQSFVKFNGHRIDPDELGEALTQVRGIASAAILPLMSSDGRNVQRLVGFFVSESAELTPDQARAGLKEILPPYMMPSRLISVPSIPLNINGKVDRAALRVIYDRRDAQLEETKYAGGADDSGAVALWRQVLDTTTSNYTDNFFQSGGDSLKAMTFLAEIEQRTGRSIETSKFMETPTLGAVIELLQDDKVVRSRKLKHVFQMRGGTEQQPPLFVVFGHLGVPSWANHIVRHLPAGRRVYGLRVGEPGDWEELGGSLDDLADVIAKEIMQVTKGETLHLIGYSFGGALAVEIAAHLRAVKQTLGRVVLFDAGVNFAILNNSKEVPNPQGPEDYLVSLWFRYRLRPVPVRLDVVQGYQSMPLPADDLSALWAMVATGGSGRHQTTLRHQDFYASEHGPLLADMLERILAQEISHPEPQFQAEPSLESAYAGRDAFLDGEYGRALAIYERMGKNSWQIKMTANAAVESGNGFRLLRLVWSALVQRGSEPSVFANLSQSARRMGWLKLALLLARRSLGDGEPGNTALVLALARLGRSDEALDTSVAMRKTPKLASDGLVLEAMVRFGMGAEHSAVELAKRVLGRSDLAIVHVLFLAKAFAPKPDLSQKILELGQKRFPEDTEIRALKIKLERGEITFDQ